MAYSAAMAKITSIVLTVLALVCPLAQSAAAAAPEAAPEKTLIQGLWAWRFEWYETPEAREEMLSFCEAHGYTMIMMQVHLDKESDPLVFRDPEAMTALVTEAAERGIAIEALDGEKRMAYEENWPRTLSILDAVLTFNEGLPDDAKLTAFHYDIEPYITPEWKEGGETRLKIMQDLLNFYVQAKAEIDRRGQGMVLACDIPMWYDNKTAPDDNCVLEFNGETKNLHQHIQDICDYVGIMSYRRHATGSNSVLYHVENELAYAEKIGKVITPALETIELKDVPQITFYGQPAEEFWNTQAEIIEALEDRPGFGGMLTHCWRGMRDMLKIGEKVSAPAH